MASRPKNIGGAQASHYYYDKDPVTTRDYSQSNGVWLDDIARNKPLKGTDIDIDQWKNLCNGLTPDGTAAQLPHLPEASQKKHIESRAFVDIPFNAPKSVSILSQFDDRFDQAHQWAVSETASWLSENYANYRTKQNGQIRYHQSGNGMLSAAFQHSLSRARDPQTHTHLVIAQVVRDDKGGYRAMDNAAMFRDQKLITQVYQSYLAKRCVQKTGCTIELKKNGFEIKGVDKKTIDVFSDRTREIAERKEQLADQYPNASQGKIDDMAAHMGREKKPKMSHDEIRDGWKAKARENGLKWEHNAIYRAPAKTADPAKVLSPGKTVMLAATRLTDTESAWSRQKLATAALTIGKGHLHIRDVETAIDDNLARGGLHSHGRQAGREILTTRQGLQAEKGNVAIVRDSRGRWENARAPKKITAAIDAYQKTSGITFTQGQRDAARMVFSSRDRINIIQGDAGTGKTATLKFVNTYAKNNGLEVIQLAPTGKAADEMHQATGARSMTVDSFLVRKGEGSAEKDVNADTVIVVDESSMLEAKKMNALLKRTEPTGAKIVFQGDKKQLQSVGAGRAFEQIQKQTTVDRTDLTDVLRQKTELTKAVRDDVKQGNMVSAVDRLEAAGAIREIDNRSERLDAIREEAVADLTKGKDTIVLTGLNTDRRELNQRIRADLEAAGKLPGRGVELITRETVNQAGVTRTIGDNFKEGQIFQAQTHIKGVDGSASMGRGKEGRITGIDRENQRLIVQWGSKVAPTTTTVNVRDEKERFGIYEERTATFSPGDRVVMLKNDNKTGARNGQIGEIRSLDDRGNITAQVGEKTLSFNAAGKENQLESDATYGYRNFTHGYAVTTHKSQGQTVDKVIYDANSRSGMVNRNSFYVAATRVKTDLSIYTDEKENFIARASEKQEKTTALHGTKAIKSYDRDQFPKIYKEQRTERTEHKEQEAAKEKQRTRRDDSGLSLSR